MKKLFLSLLLCLPIVASATVMPDADGQVTLFGFLTNCILAGIISAVIGFIYATYRQQSAKEDFSNNFIAASVTSFMCGPSWLILLLFK